MSFKNLEVTDNVCAKAEEEENVLQKDSSCQPTPSSCKCRRKCSEKISEEECNRIFQSCVAHREKALLKKYDNNSNGYNITEKCYMCRIILSDGTTVELCHEAFNTIFGGSSGLGQVVQKNAETATRDLEQPEEFPGRITPVIKPPIVKSTSACQCKSLTKDSESDKCEPSNEFIKCEPSKEVVKSEPSSEVVKCEHLNEVVRNKMGKWETNVLHRNGSTVRVEPLADTAQHLHSSANVLSDSERRIPPSSSSVIKQTPGSVSSVIKSEKMGVHVFEKSAGSDGSSFGGILDQSNATTQFKKNISAITPPSKKNSSICSLEHQNIKSEENQHASQSPTCSTNEQPDNQYASQSPKCSTNGQPDNQYASQSLTCSTNEQPDNQYASQSQTCSAKEQPENQYAFERPTCSANERSLRSRKLLRKIRREKRALGEEFFDYKGRLVPAKEWIGPLCDCKMKCCEKIPDKSCKAIYEVFCNLADKGMQDKFLIQHISRCNPRKKTTMYDVSRRLNTFSYSVQQLDGTNIKVCLEAFISMYSTTKKRIRRLQKRISSYKDKNSTCNKQDKAKSARSLRTEQAICAAKEKFGWSTLDVELNNRIDYGVADFDSASISEYGSRIQCGNPNKEIAQTCDEYVSIKTETESKGKYMSESRDTGVPREYYGRRLEPVVTENGEVYEVFTTDNVDDDKDSLQENFSGGFNVKSQKKRLKVSEIDDPDLKMKNNTGKAKSRRIDVCVGTVHPKTRHNPPCHCKMKCYEKLSEHDCNFMAEAFLEIGDRKQQDAYIISLMEKYDPKKRTMAAERNRRFSFYYYVRLPDCSLLKVCQEAFVSIYGGSKKRLRRLQHYYAEDSQIEIVYY